ncbi:hypothetical protein ACFUMH_10920 [Cellulomonas sp. NPDC057328]|uniref:hypothetical protein n=1 Tax=Cellulomonas sp. NPDC057328 TaxID=3346101 RepID=UPI00363EAACB
MERPAVRQVEFRVVRDVGRPDEVVPLVDGARLDELVGRYERTRGYEPAGGYGGLVPAYGNLGDLADHLGGGTRRWWSRDRHVALLACDCGEVGCWPLEAEVVVTDDRVTWSGFRQPHRPAWDYDGFGPFTFARDQYDAAAVVAAERVHGGG